MYGVYYQKNDDELMHYGVLGMKWGHRKVNPYAMSMRNTKVHYKKQKVNNSVHTKADKIAYKQTDEYKAKTAKRNKAIKAGAAIAGTALAAYGAYKVSKFVRNKNSQIRIGQQLAEANKNVKLLDQNFSSLKRGQNNETIKRLNDTFNKRAAGALNYAQQEGARQARSDSFATASRNVYNYYRNRR